MEQNNLNRGEEGVIINKNLSLWEALIPIFILIAILGYNVYIYESDATAGPNQFALIMGAAVAAIVGFRNKINYSKMIAEISENIKSTAGAILILLMVGALSGTWLLSGIIPTMIYYGMQILHPSVFLPACVVICSVISIATGSSWTTSATVGIALIGIGSTMGMPLGMVAGAVLSGAYFGDKLSPFSDTTNLAPAMAGTDLFTHIRYMLYTTVPSYAVTLLFFVGYTVLYAPDSQPLEMNWLDSLNQSINLSPWLLLVPAASLGLMLFRVDAIVAVAFGALAGAIAALLFQPDFVASLAGEAVAPAHRL